MEKEIVSYKKGECLIYKDDMLLSDIDENGVELRVCISNQTFYGAFACAIDDIFSSWGNTEEEVYLEVRYGINMILDDIIDNHSSSNNTFKLNDESKCDLNNLKAAYLKEIARIDALLEG